MSDHARKRRSSLHVSLVLIGGMALSNAEARTTNAPAGGGQDWTAVQGKGVITNMVTNTRSGYYRGSTYYPHRYGTSGASAASTPDGGAVSRGGFGSSAASHSSGG